MFEYDKVYNINNLDGMKEIEPNFIDTIITDPPYGLRFMGKKWDYEIPTIEMFEAMYRVLKPGGLLLCFGGTRTWHRIAVNIEDAGFEIRDNFAWIYGEGFPKARDLSKDIDKMAGAEREVIGKAKRSQNGVSEGWDRPWKEKQRTEGNFEYSITAPATDAGKLWDGWKTALKPAFEPVIIAMKPLNGTFAENALKHGVAGFNIDGGRIEIDKSKETDKRCITGENNISNGKHSDKINIAPDGNGYPMYKEGRFPANVLLDDITAELLDEQSGESVSSGGENVTDTSKSYGGGYNKGHKPFHFNDSGGASRFFYCAKASKSERNAGCEGLEKTHKTGCYGDGIGNLPKINGERPNPVRNNHPTVKPIKLMEYLCNITKTPTGGIVLDPFAGSGTTGIAAVNTGRKFIGFELDSYYTEIANKRITFAKRQPRLFY